MRRREFISLLGGAAVTWPLGARAQVRERMPRVGVLLGLGEKDPEAKARIQAFRRGMRDLGWIEGRNVQIEYRFAGSNLELIQKHVAALIKLAPDVIVANSTPVMRAVQPATSTIPIVFAVVNDPVGQGFISSLAHPGANITGFSFLEPEIVGKWISLLSDLKPDLLRIALMFNPDTAPYYDAYIRSFKAQPQRSSVALEPMHVKSVAEVEATIAELGRKAGSGLIAPGDPFILAVRGTILRGADEHRVPVISAYRQFVVEGSLMSYGPDTADIFRRTSAYVDRILRGEKPADLPVQAPTKYELVINLKAAKALGIDMRYRPRTRRRGDRVMKRREFVSLLGGAAAWPLAAHSQQPAMPVVGFSSASPEGSGDLRRFRQGLNEPAISRVRTSRSNTAGPRINSIGCRRWQPNWSAAKAP